MRSRSLHWPHSPGVNRHDRRSAGKRRPEWTGRRPLSCAWSCRITAALRARGGPFRESCA